MEYTFSHLLVLFFIGAIGSILSGMVGIGGSVIKYPMLLYIPPLLGFTAFTAQEVSAISAVQVFFSTLAALVVFKKGGYVSGRLVGYMGTAIVIGSFIGGYGSKFLADETINFVYAILASIAAVLMFFPKPKGSEHVAVEQLAFNRLYAVMLSFIVGIASGIVGAAGAFIIVPIMLVILKVPTRIAIGSSVAITFISSIGATVGKVMGGHILLVPSLVMVVASLLAAPIGAKWSQKMNIKVLEYILLVLIVATVIKIWYEMFS